MLHVLVRVVEEYNSRFVTLRHFLAKQLHFSRQLLSAVEPDGVPDDQRMQNEFCLVFAEISLA